MSDSESGNSVLVAVSDDDRAQECIERAVILWAEYQDTGDKGLLNQVIGLEREALELRLPGHPDRDDCCGNLAASLQTLYNRTGDENLLTEVIDLEREAFRLRPEGHPDRHESCGNLALSLQTLYNRTGDESLLIESIGLQREALRLHPEGHPDRGLSCGNLASSLRTLYSRIGDESLLTEAIDLHREALRLRPEGHPGRHYSCANLASSLRTLYNRTGDETLLTEAINLHYEALDLRPDGHPDRHKSCGSLAASLRTLYNCTGDESLLAEAIYLNREALKLRPEGHPDQDESCANLALSLRILYNCTGDEILLTEAIDLDREALKLRLEGHPDRAESCGSLAASLWTLYNCTGDETLLIESIGLDREALRLRLEGHPDRAEYCGNLAASLGTLYDHTGDETLLTETIDLEREALRLRPEGHPNRHYSCANLAASLSTLYNRTGDEALLAEAIDLNREALKLRPEGHPDRHYSCANLAALLWTEHNRTGNENLLAETINLYCEGAALASAHDKWWNTIALSRIHLMQATPYHNITLATQYLSQSLQDEPNDVSGAIAKALAILDLLWVQSLQNMTHIRLTLASVYQRIIMFLPLLSSPAFDLASQLQRLRDARQVGADALINAVLVGDWRAGLEHLEVAQGLIWAQRLHQRDPQFRDIPEAQKAELEICLQALSRHNALPATSSPEHLLRSSQDDLHKYSTRMYAVIRHIRAVPGLERFMLGESCETLCGVATHHPTVVLVGARGYFYAFIIASGQFCGNGPLKLDLTDDFLNVGSVYGNLSSHRGALASNVTEGHERAMRAPRKLTALDHYLQSLWLKIVKPVLDLLNLQASPPATRPRLYWCPTGPFTSVPLHAAGVYHGLSSQRQCCADYVVSSYTPTLTTLLRAQRSVTPLAKDNLALMLIAEKRAQESLALIPGVDVEIQDVAAIATSRNVKIIDQVAGSTTIGRISKHLNAANMIHLACHGVQDHDDATKSGFCLGDGRLTISELTRLDLKHGFLAFLSACETAMGSADQPDQAMHLAAAMLFAGFKSVIATMWAISDEDGPKVAKSFYEDLFSKEVIDADAVAYALGNAVQRLRESGVSSHRWVPFIHMGA